MALENMLLSELLITLVTFERFLVRVNKQVFLEIALTHRGVCTQVALEALLTLVRLLVYLRDRYGKGLINFLQTFQLSPTYSMSRDCVRFQSSF